MTSLHVVDQRVCPICTARSTTKPYFHAEAWMVLRCSHCSYAWVVDLADPEPTTAFAWGENVVQESQRRLPMYQDRIQRIEKYRPTPKRWLDIGCGGGGMLKCVIDAGYEAEGIEPSPAADYIQALLHIPVHKTSLAETYESLRFKEYGVVSYFHVLEHVTDPTAELMATRQLLGEQSLLVIEVPFFDSLPWKVMGSRHRHFYRGHRSYFNKASLTKILRKTNFSVLSCESVPYQMTLDWLLMRLGRFTNPLRQRIPRTLLERSIHINTGEYLLAIARKQ